MNFYQNSLNHGKKQVQRIVLDGDHPWLEDIYEQMGSRFDIPIIKLKGQPGASGYGAGVSSVHLNVGLGLKEV